MITTQVVPLQAMTACEEVDTKLHLFLTSALKGGEQSGSQPSVYHLSYSSIDIHWIWGCVGPRDGQDTLEEQRNFLPCQQLNHTSLANQAIA
jgi:hypothetical protein